MKRTHRVLAAAAALVLVPTVALAAPGGKGGGGSSKGNGGSGFVVPDGAYGSTVTATLADAPAMTWIESTCYQDGMPVIYNRVEAASDGSALLTLGPTRGYQVGRGGAECSADAKYWHMKRQKWVPIASTTFHVSDG